MAIVATLLDSRAATAVLRRATPRTGTSVRSCRTAPAFHRLIEMELVDAAVLGVRAIQTIDLANLRQEFPSLSIVVYGSIRPDHGVLIRELQSRGVAAFLVDGVDDPVVGEVIARNGYLARRRQELSDLPRRLRLTEDLQLDVLDRLLTRIGRPETTASLAQALDVSREHLSRQFAAGGAPNLKRVIDLLQILAARDLTVNPGYSIARIAQMLGFANESHLRTAIRRVVRLSWGDFRRSTSAELQRRFVVRAARVR